MVISGPVELGLVIFFAVSGLSLTGLALYLRSSSFGIRGVRSFVALLSLMAVWSFAAAGKLVLSEPIERFFVTLELPLGVLFVLVFFTFASQYTGHDWHRRRVFIAYVVSSLLVLGVGILTNPIHELFWSGIELSTAVFPHLVHSGLGPLYFLYVFLSYGLYCFAGYVLIDIHLRSRYNTTPVVLITLGSALPLLINIVSVVDTAPIPGLDYTPIGLAVFGVATTLSIQMDFFDIVPLARDTAVEQSNEGMLILDSELRIRDFNPTTTEFLPDLPAHRGDPIDDVVAGAESWFDTTDRTYFETGFTGEDDKHFSIQSSQITDGPHHLGWTVVISDVTEEKRRQRHLKLVSRVLRHNMANRITTIMGNAELLEPHVDEMGQDYLDVIDDSATMIMETSAKLRKIQRIVTSTRSRRSIDVTATVTGVAERYSCTYPNATVTARCPDDVYALSTIGFQPAIENLVENGIEHDPSSEPSVTIEVTTDDSWVSVSVVDSGSGIPEMERRILEEGETPLRHSSGVGLWLVYCYVEQSGHDLQFEYTDAGGSKVTFNLERAWPEDGF